MPQDRMTSRELAGLLLISAAVLGAAVLVTDPHYYVLVTIPLFITGVLLIRV